MTEADLLNLINEYWLIFLLLAIWSLVWKGLALWRSAQRKDLWWFIIILIVNTVGILEIIYLFLTRKK